MATEKNTPALEPDTEAATENITAAPSVYPEPERNQDQKQKETPSTALQNPPFDYLTGWKLHLLTLSICLCLFLSSLEVSIVSTSLISVADDLKDFGHSSWIITSYLLTYTGFLIIWSKISDICGRKYSLATAIIIFVAFSGACGGARSTVELIIFRAFQGIGGSGMISVTLAIIPEMTPPSEYPLYSSICAAAFGFSYLLGPLIGGAINERTTWRWVFYLNLPAGLLNLLTLLIAAPSAFPHHLHPRPRAPILSLNSFQRVDLIGFVLLLSASTFTVTTLSESGIRYRWSSALSITFLVLCALLWLSFILWSKYITHPKHKAEPVFTFHFLCNRTFMGLLLCSFAAGVPFTVSILSIPQRLQACNDFSPLKAGYYLLPFAVSVPAGSLFQSTSAHHNVPPIVLLLIGAILQIAGTAATSTLAIEQVNVLCGMEVISGLGVGITLGILILYTPFVVPRNHTSVAMGSITQIRALGGVIGFAICTNVLNTHLTSSLSSHLSPPILNGLLQSISTIGMLEPKEQEVVRKVFGEGYNRQMHVVAGFAAVQVLCLGLVWEWERGGLRRIGGEGSEYGGREGCQRGMT